jgi:hypothetical protein
MAQEVILPGARAPEFRLSSTPDQKACGAPRLQPRTAAAFPAAGRLRAKGAVARAYGVYREADGICERALFVIDGEGTVA